MNSDDARESGMHDFARLALLIFIFAPGCATTHAGSSRSGEQPIVVSVGASSIPSGYGVQLRLEGNAVVRGDWLYVELPTGSVRTYQGTTDVWYLEIRAGLATCNGNGSWRLVSESRATRVAPLVGLTRDNSMIDTTVRVFSDTLRLDLGVPRGTELAHSWLTFEVAWPIQSVIADYTLATGTALTASSEHWGAARTAERLCRPGSGS